MDTYVELSIAMDAGVKSISEIHIAAGTGKRVAVLQPHEA
jgi:hypothetical protein